MLLVFTPTVYPPLSRMLQEKRERRPLDRLLLTTGVQLHEASHDVKHGLHSCTYDSTLKHSCTHACRSHCTAKPVSHYAICFALYLPYGHLCVCTVRHTHCTHTASNSAHHKGSDSLYRCCFYFTLIQNRHTLRNTNRCTQAHTHNLLIQNTSRTNRKQFQAFSFPPLSLRNREESSASGQKHQAERAAWQTGVKVIAVGLT